MAIRKIGRDPEGIESLKLYASLTPQQALGADLQDQARLDEFADRVKRGVSGSVRTPTRLHGLRVEALFRAVLVALGGFTLLTDVDGGEPYFDDASGPVKPPDFSIVDRSGEQLLIEVKSVPPLHPLSPHTISETEMRGLQHYGRLMKAPVAVAHYWSAWNRWTLVRLDLLKQKGKKYAISPQEALASNELSRYGDCLVGTRPPLTLILNVEQTGKHPAASDHVEGRVTGVKVSAAGVVLKDKHEANIAWFLMRFGDWPAQDPQLRIEDGVPQAVEVSVNPPPENLDLVERQGFAGIGMLSSMYSSMYNEMTLTRDGDVRELRHEPDPGELAALIPDGYWDRKDRQLALWRFHIEPSSEEATKS
jgi:Holliday junction resolvase